MNFFVYLQWFLMGTGLLLLTGCQENYVLDEGTVTKALTRLIVEYNVRLEKGINCEKGTKREKGYKFWWVCCKPT